MVFSGYDRDIERHIESPKQVCYTYSQDKCRKCGKLFCMTEKMWKYKKNMEALMEKRKLIIDCDPGVDDALMLAFAAAHREEFDILAVTTVNGNQDIEKVTRNALDLTAFYGLKVPVAKGMGLPLVKEPHYAPETHGESGLGTCRLPASPEKAEEEPAVLFLYRILAGLPEEEKITIAATGPLTNIAVLLRLFPEVKRKIREILFMGGSLCGGNVTTAAEFNFYVDPEAAKIVFYSQIPLVMCGLDVTEKCTLTRNQILKLCQSGYPAARACGDMMGFALENTSEKYRGEVSVHDAAPLMYLLYPGIFSGQNEILDVDCSDGPSRGAVLGGFRWWRNEETEANVFVLTDVDREKFQEYLITALYALGEAE